MSLVRGSSTQLRRLGILTTLLDAGREFVRGRPASGILLLAAAALSSRLSGLGVGVSVLLRLYRRLR